MNTSTGITQSDSPVIVNLVTKMATKRLTGSIH